MRTEIVIDLKRLLDDVQYSHYRKKFGTSNRFFLNRSNLKSIKITKVEDEEGTFVNLFGLSVNTVNGDIALGIFPDPNCYICVGNFYKEFSLQIFEKKSLPEFVDKKELIELLKVNLSSFLYNYRVSFIDMLKNYESEESGKSKSIILEIVRRNSSKVVSPNIDLINRVKPENIISLVNHCVNVEVMLESVAVDYFGAFISEESPHDLLLNIKSNTTIQDVLNSNLPNLSTLYAYYKSYNIDMDFLKALNSYGMGIKQRKNVVNLLDSSTSNYSDFTFYAGLLSSMMYLDSTLNNVKFTKEMSSSVICYNIIDLLYSIGWENAFVFSIDLLKDLKNRTVFDNLVERHHIGDLLLENKIKQKDFVTSLDSYIKVTLSNIDKGCMYTRKVRPTQYALMSFSSKQVVNAGRVFENLSGMLKNKISNSVRS